ncbi:hypothetical protein TNCV_3173661 [Trichonephila clavipes]|nr:hypothetical protein TNCV_3173661 [Trichonephila clavipes]
MDSTNGSLLWCSPPQIYFGDCSHHLRLARNAEADKTLRCQRRQYEQMQEFERGKIIGMMLAGLPVRRVAREVSRYDLTVKRCWD